MSDYDSSIHSNPDALAWAKFFMETKKQRIWTIEEIDEDLMLAWFANAMMAMYDSQKKEGYVLVPVEPTTAMEEAFLDIYERRGWFMRGYKNMIKAAQEEE